MAFANPLLGLVAIVLLGIIFGFMAFLRKKRGWYRPTTLVYPKTLLLLNNEKGEEPGKNLTVGRSDAWLKRLRLLALALMILALARAQKFTVENTEPIEGVDIMLVMDTSPSMQAIDFDPLTRMQAAKDLALDFVNKRKNDRIGLVIFGGHALLSCPLTLDHEALSSFLNQVEVGMTQTDGTAIGSGVMTAVAHLRKIPSKSKIIVLLTDGRSNAGQVDPITASKTARSFGVKIYSIGTGKRGGGIFKITDPIFGTRLVRAPEEEIDENTLIKISNETQAKYFRATNLAEFRDIFSEIDALEKTSLEPPRRVIVEDLHIPFLLSALALLGLEILLKTKWLFSIP